MTVCKDGLNRMFGIIDRATGDIKHRLWTLYWLVRMTHTPQGVAVELGTRNGDSTRAMLAAAADVLGAVYSFDCEDCSHVVTDPYLHSYWQFHRKDSAKAGWEWSGMVDMVFVDTDHLYATTKGELEAWAPRVRQGGCMAFHDYWLDDASRAECGHGVKQAVDEWANKYQKVWRLETWDAGPDGDTGMAVIWRIG